MYKSLGIYYLRSLNKNIELNFEALNKDEIRDFYLTIFGIKRLS